MTIILTNIFIIRYGFISKKFAKKKYVKFLKLNYNTLSNQNKFRN